MGFFLTLLYTALALLSPQDLFPVLGEYRIEVFIVILTLLFSVPALAGERLFRIPQVYLLAGLCVATSLSIMIGVGWIGGGLFALEKFLPGAMVFYFVVLNCKGLRQLKVLVAVIALVAAFDVGLGAKAYYAADSVNGCRTVYGTESTAKVSPKEDVLPACNPLLQAVALNDGTYEFRMRAMGFLRDPNELAQFLVMSLPLLWIWWEKKRTVHNLLFVIAPSALFVWGMYLTHSRGGLIGLMAILMLALKDRVRLVPALAVGAAALSVLIGLNFAGGREISVQAGSDRFAIWGETLAMFKEAPVFGIGYGMLHGGDFGRTAHNSFLECLAELGLVGFLLWMGLIVFTLSGLNSLIAALKPKDAEMGPAGALGGSKNLIASDEDSADIDRWARVLRLSLSGFLATAFFLSRAYVLTLWLTLGMAVVVLCLAAKEEESIDRQPVWRLLGQSAKYAFLVIALIYACLRFRSMLI